MLLHKCFLPKKGPDIEMNSRHPIRGIMNSNMLISLSKIDFVFFPCLSKHFIWRKRDLSEKKTDKWNASVLKASVIDCSQSLFFQPTRKKTRPTQVRSTRAWYLGRRARRAERSRIGPHPLPCQVSSYSRFYRAFNNRIEVRENRVPWAACLYYDEDNRNEKVDANDLVKETIKVTSECQAHWSD